MNKKFGIPTLHNGRRYRSRLEARWGSFFDLLGWQYEYEPFELKGWIPDFILLGELPVLVEIKPETVFPAKVAGEIERSGAEHECLILGCTIPIRPLEDHEGYEPNIPFGWLAERSGNNHFWWEDAMLGRWTEDKVGFCHSGGIFRDRISGKWHGNCFGSFPIGIHEVTQLWATAGNATQWRPGR